MFNSNLRFSWSLSWSRVFILSFLLVFFYKFPPQILSSFGYYKILCRSTRSCSIIQLATKTQTLQDEEDYNQSIVDYPEYNTSTSKEITEIQVKEFETAVKELDANGGLKDYGLDYKHKMGSQTGVVVSGIEF